MIPDEAEDDTIDFSWYYYVGVNRLGMTYKQVGRITMRLFHRLYFHYRNTWSLEMRLAKANMTYDELAEKVKENEDLF